MSVLSPTEAVLRNTTATLGVNLPWCFPSDEPADGVTAFSGGVWYLESAGAFFRPWHVGRYVHFKSGLNLNTYFKIQSVVDMSRVVLEGTPLADTTQRWQCVGSGQHVDIVERPLQITIT